MTPEVWPKIKAIFAKAVPLSPQNRITYLKKACRGDAALRREVESLLAAYDRPGTFLGILSTGGSKFLLHYEILERIGEGGMALVYKARDTHLDRLVALKVLPAWLAGHTRSRERLLEEARYASALNHPNIVTVYDIGHENGMDFIVMEHLAGKTLREIIPQKGLPVRRALQYALPVAEALSSAHKAGILHRDLKPSNIMVTRDGRVKLLDFGLAAPIRKDRQKDKSTRPDHFGTSIYMAPEQITRQSVSPRSDIFSFGLVLYEMLVGRHAFETDDRQKTVTAILKTPFAGRFPAKVPQPLATIVTRCLEKEPKRRFQSMQEISASLKSNSRTDAAPSAPRSVPMSATTKTNLADYRKLRSALRRISYQSVADSREAFEEICSLLKENESEAMRDAIITPMGRLLLGVPKVIGLTQQNPVRVVRRLVVELLKLATGNTLHSIFEANQFEYLDLHEMNFASEQLVGFSFRRCFLVQSTFRDSDLTGASFAQAYIRNVDFTGAQLKGADFSESDWFNTVGLTVDQVRSAKLETFMRCPVEGTEMHGYLEARYDVPYSLWPRQAREQLTASWNEYWRAGGLCRFVNKILENSK